MANKLLTPSEFDQAVRQMIRNAEKEYGLRKGELLKALVEATKKLDALPVPKKNRKWWSVNV